MRIIYCVDNKLGGVTSLNYNLVANNTDKKNIQCLLHIDCEEWDMTRAGIQYPADENVYFQYSIRDNYYCTLKKLHQLIPFEEGALVVNYDNEMAMLDHYPVKQTVYQLVHDDYNVKLAKAYGHIADVFICHNSVIYQELLNHFPERKNDIYFLPHGVHIPAVSRQPGAASKPIQLLFLGRMAGSKGIFDLPVISEYLRKNKVDFEWTCIGNGPDLGRLKEVWGNSDKVSFLSPKTNEEVLEICASKDVFVLPTKFEGSPVSLVETMSTGLVPVITDLPGGITDIVSEEIGFRITMDDNAGFADAVSKLYFNRALLNEMSVRCREKIIEKYNVQNTAVPYHTLFAEYARHYKTKQLKKIKVGARLDQPFIPNAFTRMLRRSVRAKN